MTPLDQWLEAATRDLAPESAAQVRAEIEQHRDPALNGDVDVAALGDPKLANRAYRRVLLTREEALTARVFLQPGSHRDRAIRMAVLISVLAVVALFASRFLPDSPLQWIVFALILGDAPLRLFFPANTESRSRRYLQWSVTRYVVITALLVWEAGWFGGLGVQALAFLVYLDYWRFNILRKLKGGVAPALPLANPSLTPVEAIFLNTLRHGDPSQPYVAPLLLVLLGGMTYWLPATYGPFTALMTANFFLPRLLPVYTPARGRYYRFAKWIGFALAAIIPFVFGARVPWVGVFSVAFVFWMFETKRISLRRKLPIEEWPRELYL